MTAFRACSYCAGYPWECECDNDVASHTDEGYPMNKSGYVLTHLLTREQKQELMDKVLKAPNMRVRQAD